MKRSSIFCCFLTGMRAEADILKMVATLLVLQLMRIMGLGEGQLLKTLLRLKDSSAPTYGTSIN